MQRGNSLLEEVFQRGVAAAQVLLLIARQLHQLKLKFGWIAKEAWLCRLLLRVLHFDFGAARPQKVSKVKPFVLYSLRHTMLTRLGQSGADPFTIQKIAGHSSITISTRYVHPTPEMVEKAFVCLENLNKVRNAEAQKEQSQSTETIN